MVTKTFRSCKPAWLEMDRKVCPTATTSLHTYLTIGLLLPKAEDELSN